MANKKSKIIESGGSLAGFHFYNLYENCQYKLLMSYVFGWEPRTYGPAMLNGTCMHAAKEFFYKSTFKGQKRVRESIEVYLNAMTEAMEKTESVEKLATLRGRGPTLFQKWYDIYGERDIKENDIIWVEEERTLDIPWGDRVYKITGKVDALIRNKATKAYKILDTKTTGFSKKEVELSVELGDQATTYIAMFHDAFPKVKKFDGFQADIMYWHDNAKDANNIDIYRPAPVRRTKLEIEEYRIYMGQLIAEVSAKVAAFKAGEYDNPVELFRRNTQWCHSFFKRCEFADYCRGSEGYRQWSKGKVPFLFKKRQASVVNRMIKGDV